MRSALIPDRTRSHPLAQACHGWALVFALALPPPAISGGGEDGSPPGATSPGSLVRDTQLNLRLELPMGERRFRATVLRRNERSLLILTAAHCLSRLDRSREIDLLLGERSLKAVVRQVVRNPSFDSAPPDAIPGADNALALIDVEPEDDEEAAILARLRPAELVRGRLFRPDGEVASVVMIDQKEREHELRAANYGNPRWLEWGPKYQPIPGDSGSGVFITLAGEPGKRRALLVGVVTDRSPTGGGASLVHGREPWLVEGIAGMEKLLGTPSHR
jgi:hypothetical protein